MKEKGGTMKKDELKQIVRGMVLEFLRELSGEETVAGAGEGIGEAEPVPVSSIHVGTRYRRDLGDLRGLMLSIQEIGLLHPILIRTDGRLVCGWRRLEACRRLGMTHITARRARGISDERIVQCELAENAWKPLLPTELVAVYQAAVEEERAEAKDHR